MVYTEVGWASDETHPLSQANMKTLDSGVLSAHRGWRPVTEPGGELITADTTFSIGSGEYEIVRVHLRGTLNGLGRIALRVNADVTADLHRTADTVFRMSDGAVVSNNTGNATTWGIARWSDNMNVAQATIYNTNSNSNLAMEGSGFRSGSASADRERTISGGDLADLRLLSSLRVLSTIATLASVRVWIDGLRT